MLSGKINKRILPCIAVIALLTTIAAIAIFQYTNYISGTIQDNASEMVKQIHDSIESIENKASKLQNIDSENKKLIESALKQLSLVRDQINHKFVNVSKISVSKTYIFAGISIILIVVTLFAIWFAERKMNKPLRHSINGLAESTKHVTKASLNVSYVSQAVSERTSEQAELLQDILSNLKEIASMANQNAEDVHTADKLMKNIGVSAQETTHFMDAFAEFMVTIISASEQSSKIVQSIDDVAFQTNILALNAAIEAARVGNAGEGFAVVADEVRSLSRQVTKASGEISDLLKGITQKITQGMEKFNKTNTVFHEVADNVAEISVIVNKVTKVSAEQTQSIDAAYDFINEIKDIALQNVKESDRSASASVEMSAQAEQLQSFVEEVKFVALGEGHFDKSMHAIVKKELKKGEYLIRQGEFSEEAYIIEEGEFNIFLDENPDQIVATLKEGDIVGEIALIKNVRRTANVVAKTPGRVVVLCKEDCMDVLGKQKVLSESVANMIKRRLEELA